MPFCKNCGKELADNVEFCPSCGTKQGFETNTQTTPVPAPAPAPTGDADVQANKGISVLSYFGILLLIPLFARKDSEYCKFHVKQGATLFALDIVILIVRAIVLAISRAIFKGELVYGYITYFYQDSIITRILSFMFSAVMIAILVLDIIGIVNAATGKKKELPLVGQIPFIGDLMDKIYAAINK